MNNNLKNLESLYLEAKIKYYEGNSILSDSEFDALEQKLKELNSKVIEQVGSKRSDFDFPHPTRMLSLAKIQTECIDNITNYQIDLFMKWFNSRLLLIEKKTRNKPNIVELEYSPKFDGNSINIIYKGNKLDRILTRGDGDMGKNVTEKLKNKVPQKLELYNIDYNDNISIEIRCEVVIDINLFNEKYSEEFANARNYVAGVISKDEIDMEKLNELDIIPLQYLVDGKNVSKEHFVNKDINEENLENTLEKISYKFFMKLENYEDTIKKMEDYRKTSKYQLDGVVITFPNKYKDILGVNSHDPEYSIAIKFVPEEVISEIVEIEWNIGKTGELSPVVILKPVQLAGTTVKRASGYNAGYIINNKIGKGSLVSLAKAGDIIPEIQRVITFGEYYNLPSVCPDCNSELTFDNIHLMCNNETCCGRIAKILHTSAKAINLKNVGPEVLKKFGNDFITFIDLLIWILFNKNNQDAFIKYGFKKDSRSLEIFINAFKNIKSLTYAQVILLLGKNNAGLKLTEQVANYYCNVDYDFKGHEKVLVEYFKNEDIKKWIDGLVEVLERLNIKINKPMKAQINKDIIYCCLTGSPKPLFSTKEEFLKKYSNLNEVSINDKLCNLLVTDDYNSTSSKMKTAEKKKIKIMSYEDFVKNN